MTNPKEPIYIIGDVHGCYKTLLALIDQFPNKQNSKIVFVGDLIDKGPNSKAVIDFIKDNDYDCVLGNHEIYFIEYSKYLEKKLSYFDIKNWFDKNGGEETINSYRKDDGLLDEKTLLEHSKWLQTLPLYLEYKDIKIKNRYLVVTHSHVFDKWKYKDYPKDSKEYKSFENTVLSSRFKNCDNLEIFNVYGHTPTKNPILEEHKATIDLGCVYAKIIEGAEGKLCALEFPSMKIFTQENMED